MIERGAEGRALVAFALLASVVLVILAMLAH